MKFPRRWCLLCFVASTFIGLVSPSFAKPPAKTASQPIPAASPASVPAISPTDNLGVDPLARWILQQNGGLDSISLPFSHLVQAASGKNVFPLDAANARDAAIIAIIGAGLDHLLPQMNRPDSKARVAARDGSIEEVATRIEDELAAILHSNPAPAPTETTLPHSNDHIHAYPAVQINDPETGKAYYLSVALYPTGHRELMTGSSGVARALTIHPADCARRITADGSCLLIGIEHDGKFGPNLAFLNWEIIDLAKLSLRLTATFEAAGADLSPAGAVVTDGRKGRD